MATDIVALDGDIGNLSAIHIIEKFRKRERLLRSPAGRSLEQIEKRDEKQPDYDPEGEVLAEIIHG
jgi:hypothetical protein